MPRIFWIRASFTSPSVGRSQVAFDEHFASDHIAEWCGAWKNLGICDRKLSIYEVGEPQAIPPRAQVKIA